MDGSGHQSLRTPPRGMSLAPTVRPPAAASATASPAGLTRARPASASTRLRQKPGDVGQPDFFASLGVESTSSAPARRNASFTAGSNRSFSNITMRTSASSATTTTTTTTSSSGLSLPTGLSAGGGFRSGTGFFASGTSSTSATPTGASTALGGTSSWRSPAAGSSSSMFGAAGSGSSHSSSLRSPAFSSRTTSFNSGLASPAAAALQSPAAAALQAPSPFAMKSPAARNWSAPPMRTATPSGANSFATSSSATPTRRSFATAGSFSGSMSATPTHASYAGAASTARSFAGSASATPTHASYTGATSTAGSFAGSASATPTHASYTGAASTAGSFAGSASATPTHASYTGGASTAGSFAGSASATPTHASYTGGASTAGSFAGSASATPTHALLATTATTASTTTTSAGTSLGRTVTARQTTQAATTSSSTWASGLPSADTSTASGTVSAVSRAAPSSVSGAIPSAQKPAQLFSMDDADAMFEDDGWGCDSPSTVLSNPMEEAESAETQTADKEDGDDFGWAEDDFAMVDAALSAQPDGPTASEPAGGSGAGSKAVAATATFSMSSVTPVASSSVESFSYGAKSVEQPWSTSRPSLPSAMDSKHTDNSLASHQDDLPDAPVFAESKTEESRANDSEAADLPKVAVEEFEIPTAEGVAAVATAGDFWNDDDDDEGLFDHDDHANEEWDETIRGTDEDAVADKQPQQHNAVITPASVEPTSVSFVAAETSIVSEEKASEEDGVHQATESVSASEEISLSASHDVEAYSTVDLELRSHAESSMFLSTEHSVVGAENTATEQARENSWNSSDNIGASESAATASVPYSGEHSAQFGHHPHGVSFADEIHSESSNHEQKSSIEEQSIVTSTTNYDQANPSGVVESAEHENNGLFSKSGEASEAGEDGGEGGLHAEQTSVEASSSTPGKELDSEDHSSKTDGNDEYRGDSVSFFSGVGSSSGGQSLGSFSEVSSRLPPYGYQSSYRGPGSEASSTERSVRDMDGSSIRSYGVSSAGATFGGSERVSEGAFSDGTASETPSIVNSSNASTAFGTDFPSVSEGQFSAPGTTFGGSDNVSDQFSDGNASETASVSESVTHTTNGFVSQYQPSTGHYVTETIAESSSSGPFPDDSMDERASHNLESTEDTTVASASSLFGSTGESTGYNHASLSFSRSHDSSRTQYTSVNAAPTETTDTQEGSSNTKIQSADALFGSSSDADSGPFSSFGSAAAPSNTPAMTVEHELPTSDASELFGSSAPSGGGGVFGSAPSHSSGFGYDNTSYGQGYHHDQDQQQSYEQQSYDQFGQGQSATAQNTYGSGYNSYDYARGSQYAQPERDPFQHEASSAPAHGMFSNSTQNASAGDAASLFASTSSAASNAFETSSHADSYFGGSTPSQEQPGFASASNFFGGSVPSHEPRGYYSGNQASEAPVGGSSNPSVASAENLFAGGGGYSRGNDAAQAYSSSSQQSASELFGSNGPPAAADSPFNTSGSYAPTPAHATERFAPALERRESASSVFSTHSAQSTSFEHSHSDLPHTPSSAAEAASSALGASSGFAHRSLSSEHGNSFGYGERRGVQPPSDSSLPKHPHRGIHSSYETNEFFYATSRQTHQGFVHGSTDASSYFGSSSASGSQQSAGTRNATPASADTFFGQSSSPTDASIHGTNAPSTPGATPPSNWFESNSSVTAPPNLQRGASNASSTYSEHHHGTTTDTEQWGYHTEAPPSDSSASALVTGLPHGAGEAGRTDQGTVAFGYQEESIEHTPSGLVANSANALAVNQPSTSIQNSSPEGYSNQYPPSDVPTEREGATQLPQQDTVPGMRTPDEVSSDVKEQQEPKQAIESSEPASSGLEEQAEQEHESKHQTQGDSAFETSHEAFGSDANNSFDQIGSDSAASSLFTGNDAADSSADPFGSSASPFENAGESSSLFATSPPQAGAFEGVGQQNDFFASGPPGNSAPSFYASEGYTNDTYGQQGQQQYGANASPDAFGGSANQSGSYFDHQYQEHHQYQQQQYQQPNEQQQYDQAQHQYNQVPQQQQSTYQQHYQHDQHQFGMQQQQQQQQQGFAHVPQVASPQSLYQQQANVGGYDQGYSSMNVQQQQQQQPPQLQQFPTARPAGLNRAYGGRSGFGAAKPAVSSPSTSAGLSSMTPATHSPAVRTSNKYKDPTRVAPSCLTAFGFGGNVVTMFPKRKLLLNIAGSSFRNSPRPVGTSQLEHAGHGELRKGPVGIYRMEQLHPKDDFMEQLDKFPGPLTDSVGDDAVLQYLEERMQLLEASGGDASEDERLLLGVLRVLVKCNGKLCSSSDATTAPGSRHSDPSSPEALLIELLRESDRRRQAMHPVAIPAPRPPQTGMHPDVVSKNAAQIRELLLVGDRVAAVEAAMSAHMWAEALLLASSTTQDEYRRVVRQFLDAHYSSGDPSRALLLALSDQQEKSVQEPQRLLQTRLHPHKDDHATPTSLILATWTRHVQILVANANPDTSSILTELGDRLWREKDAVVAAHTCYLLAGVGVDAPSPAAKMALLGADHRSPSQARFYVSASSVQRTEVYEWSQRRALGSSAAIQLPFQGYKLIHAMVLADHGKLETAFRYVSAMLSVIRGITATMKPGTSMYLEGMQNQLTVLDDRLRQHLGQDRVATVAAEVAASNSRAGGAGGRQGKWGLGSMLRKMGNVVNSIVEGGDAPPIAATSSAALNAGGLFAGAGPGAVESPSASSTPLMSAFASDAPGSARGGDKSASGSVPAPGSSRSVHDYSAPALQQQQQPPTSTSSSGPFSGRGGESYAPPPAPSQQQQQQQYEQQQYEQQQYHQQQQYEQQQYDQQQQYEQQQYDQQQSYEQQQYGQQQPFEQAPSQYEQPTAPPPGPHSSAGSVGSGPPSSRGPPLVAASSASQPKFFGYNMAAQQQQQQQPPRSNDSRASHGYGPGSTSGTSGPAMMAPMPTPPLSSSSTSSLPGSRFQKPQLDLSSDAGPRGALLAQDKAPVTSSGSADAKEMLESKASSKATVLASSGPASDKGKASPKHQDAKKSARSKTPPPSSSKSSSGWFKGLSSLASGFIASKMNPDAKVAKLGEQMEAYYDEDKKRWVFPGETEAEEPAMPSAPPIGPLPGSTPASTSGMPSTGPPPASSGPQSAPGSTVSAADDPLAALMAPPPMRAHAALMQQDPLAAMMAPPPARGPGAYGSARGRPGPGAGRPSRPQFKVFKPMAPTTTSPAPPSDGGGDAPPPSE